MSKSKVVILNTFKLYTEAFGVAKDPCILLIAGAAAPGKAWSNNFCSELSQAGYFVLRYDHRDTGASSAIDYDNNSYTLATLACDALTILDAYAVKKCHIVGHSMGGYIAQYLALNYQDRVVSITALSAGPLGTTADTNKPLSKREKALSDKTWHVFLERKDTDGVEGFLRVWHYLSGDYYNKKIAYNYTKALYNSPQQSPISRNHEKVMALVHSPENMQKNAPLLKNITVPVLVIHGQKDVLMLPKRTGSALAHALPQSQLALIPGMGHMILSKRLEHILIKKIIAFLKR